MTVVRGPPLRSHLDLLGDVRHTRHRDLPGVLREPGLHLEEFGNSANSNRFAPDLLVSNGGEVVVKDVRTLTGNGHVVRVVAM
ncbi:MULTISPECIES: hypothetical protein [Streptomyces]|uniref:hypothetical protein n=1 Tax=Streptomyces TaxID=1883 RepID=UPI00056A4AA6|nr:MULTISPECIES: hypothetical protein [Streptomyces]THA90713.1 hypothetical protein E6R61_20020 [Streptomyces sp. LRa12]MBQ0947385.1 hypothetical protein [Streptomyces sp. RK76]MDX3371550.1 hypothetical protein [Streptomyces sp. ME02-6987-2C]MDX3406197.1 hypothetical protein [Streptomyces sp. ME02-6977A]MDX3422001.1 hypothetical protein [Streptomyces sp. ME02-6985-2c]